MNKTKLIQAVAVGLTVLSLIIPAQADQAQADKQQSDQDAIISTIAKLGDHNVSVVNLDLAVPDSPAFAILGLTPSTVVQPTSYRDFALSILNGSDQRGNIQSGVAINIMPLKILNAQEIQRINSEQTLHGLTIHQYATSYPTQVLYRTRFDLGTAKGNSSADKSARIALGLSTTLYDEADPILGLDNQLRADLKKATELNGDPPRPFLMAPPQVGPGTQLLALDAYVAAVKNYINKNDPSVTVPAEPADQTPAGLTTYIGQLQDAALKAHDAAKKKFDESATPIIVAAVKKAFANAKIRDWNATSVVIGYSPSWASAKGTFDTLSTSTQGLWATAALRVGGNAQFLVHGRHLTRDLVTDPNNSGQFLRQDSDVFGGRLRIGSSTAGFSLEGANFHDKPQGLPSQTYTQISVGSEFKITDSYWLAFSVGGDNKKNHHDSFVMGNLKWGFNSGPTLR